VLLLSAHARTHAHNNSRSLCYSLLLRSVMETMEIVVDRVDQAELVAACERQHSAAAAAQKEHRPSGSSSGGGGGNVGQPAAKRQRVS
jgi:hypothetical protein